MLPVTTHLDPSTVHAFLDILVMEEMVTMDVMISMSALSKSISAQSSLRAVTATEHIHASVTPDINQMVPNVLVRLLLDCICNL